MRSDKDFVIGVDLGGTNVRAAVVNVETGTILARSENVPSHGMDGVEATSRQSATAITQAIKAAGVSISNVLGVGMAVPGHVHAAEGMVMWAPNFKDQWRGVPVAALVSGFVGLPVKLGNDANLAALGEFCYGAGIGSRHLVMLTLGTGIGGGVIIDGRLLLGCDGGAAELGHVFVSAAENARGGNAAFGTLEGLAQRDAIIERAARKISTGRKTSLSEGDYEKSKLTPKSISHAAGLGDALAIEVIEETGYYIGLGVASFINTFNPEVFVIGGGIAQAGDLLMDIVRRTAKVNAIPTLYSNCRIELAKLGDNAGIMGGAALAASE